MIQQCLWNRLPLFQPQLYLPTAASPSPLRPLDGGGVAGLTLASRRIPTVAKVFWTVAWPLDGLICCPSLPAERVVLRLNALMVWNLRSSHRRVQTVSISALCLRLFMASGNIFYPAVTHIVSSSFILSVLQIFCQENFGKDHCCLRTDRKENLCTMDEKNSSSTWVQGSCAGIAAFNATGRGVIQHRWHRCCCKRQTVIKGTVHLKKKRSLYSIHV